MVKTSAHQPILSSLPSCGSTQSFFRDCNDASRVPLDPIPWISNGPMPLQPELDAGPDLNDNENQIDEARLQAAITSWRRSPKGSGNDDFFQFALELRKAGMNKAQIENMLQSEAAFGHSPNERKAQISSIINSLGKSHKRSRHRMGSTELPTIYFQQRLFVVQYCHDFITFCTT